MFSHKGCVQSSSTTSTNMLEYFLRANSHSFSKYYVRNSWSENWF